ncbi:MAG: MBOAT family O-acyltransferase [Bdellovibrionota bacterium]
MPSILRNTVALIASYFFYAWGAPDVILILIVSTIIDYFVSKQINHAQLGSLLRKVWLGMGVIFNLGFLLYYKYANFLFEQINFVRSWSGLEAFEWDLIILPIGVSFFTFQKISYLVDVYRAKVPPAKGVLNYALYVTLFPQLIAGPIIRYHDVAQQIETRLHSLHSFYYGSYRFCLGFAKKVLIADMLGVVADNIFGLSNEILTLPYAWLGIICYAFQIYFDFAGYSDMAIGLGRMIGFKFLENFNRPYIAQTFTEFWRRWHISLSNWMKEYLYFPLGGNRVSPIRMYLNLWIVFLLSGLWHGASWSFLVWGAYHGLFLVLDKLCWIKISKRIPQYINVGLTFLLVLIGWVFFRAETLAQALDYLYVMFDLRSINQQILIYPADIIHNRAWIMLGVAILLSFAPLSNWYQKLTQLLSEKFTKEVREVATGVFAFVCFLFALCSLATAGYVPFLYFKF